MTYDLKLNPKSWCASTLPLCGGFWQVYYVYRGGEKVFSGWKLFEGDYDEELAAEHELECKYHIWDNGGMEKFPTRSQLSDYAQNLIIRCHFSDNEMWFVEYEDAPSEEILNELKLDITNWPILAPYITFDEDGCAITVYGGISEAINWM